MTLCRILWHSTNNDSHLLLPVCCRRDLVLAVHSSDELLEVLEDLSQLRVVPLMQAVLFDS
jgi:hypothetical protein